MVFCMMWVDAWFSGINWQCYIQRSHGPTQAWPFAPSDHQIVMRFPDPLVCQV